MRLGTKRYFGLRRGRTLSERNGNSGSACWLLGAVAQRKCKSRLLNSLRGSSIYFLGFTVIS